LPPLQNKPRHLYRLFYHYGMLIALLGLALLFSLLTIQEQESAGGRAADKVLRLIKDKPAESKILIITKGQEEESFVQRLQKLLTDQGFTGSYHISGSPAEIRRRIEGFIAVGQVFNLIVTTQSYGTIIDNLTRSFPELQVASIITPPPYYWPTFLLPDNLRNVANQITVIAIVAIGMTMVIITAGIDLSVGSLIALSAVIAAWAIAGAGGAEAGTMMTALCCIAAIVISGAVGGFSGLMITRFKIPPFIATLAMMQVAAGLAYIISQGKPIYQLPDNFVLLGRGAEPLLGIPYAVILMLLLYIIAHLVMSKTTFGRYIYAVGGNMEAARLAGIRVNRILISVYIICGLLTGLGGIIMASQLKSGAPTYGLTYELYVIAAVVVGGASLSGGEGKIFGTLIGAFIIAIIQNGMNLTNVESYTQKVVLGLVILAAVLLDRLKQKRMGTM